MRLRADIWVAAYLRRCQTDGVVAVLRKRGAAVPVAVLGASALLLLPALLGMQCGQWLRGRLSPVRFRFVFMSALALLAIWMLLRTL